MNNLKIIFILCIFISSGCKDQIKSDIDNTFKRVEEAKVYTNSDETKMSLEKIKNEKELTNLLINKLDEANSTELNGVRDSIIKICNDLLLVIDETEQLLIPTDSLDGIKFENSVEYIDYIFLKKGNASNLRTNIHLTIEELMKICIENKLEINRKELPLQLILFMEKKGKTWENYMFSNMPSGALFPIMKKFKNDVILTKITILEELVNMYK